MCSGSSMLRSQSKLSQCPRSHARPVLVVRLLPPRRRRNSWWKCQCPLLLGLRMWRWRLRRWRPSSGWLSSCPITSRPMTFQFLSLIFKVFPPGQSSRAPSVVEQHVDIPVPAGGALGFLPRTSHRSSTFWYAFRFRFRVGMWSSLKRKLFGLRGYATKTHIHFTLLYVLARVCGEERRWVGVCACLCGARRSMSQKLPFTDVAVAGGKSPRSMEVDTPHSAHGFSEQEGNFLKEHMKSQRAWWVMCVGAGWMRWVGVFSVVFECLICFFWQNSCPSSFTLSVRHFHCLCLFASRPCVRSSLPGVERSRDEKRHGP